MLQNKFEFSPFFILFVLISFLLFFVFAPFISILALAAVFAVLLNKTYEMLTRFLGGWKNVSATITVGLTLILFIVPLFFFGTQILQEVQDVYIGMYDKDAHYLQTIQNVIENSLRNVFPGFVFNINAYIEKTFGVISNNLGSLVYQTFFVIFQTFLMLLALFFFLRDGRSILSSFSKASPLGEEVTREIFEKMYQTIGSVIHGTLVNAIIRWAGISLAFYIFGIPNFILWGALGGIVGAIPGLGTMFAFVPAVIYLYLQGNMLSAIGLAFFGIALIILVDNILTAYFFGRGFSVSPIFVLFSILGGIVFLGPLGFILGPLILSVFLSIARVYGISKNES